jgi:lambda family phage portal protein
MIGRFLDSIVAQLSPTAGLKRAQARAILARSYAGAEPSRLDGNRRPQNRPADQEMMGPAGADKLRAWARTLVRDNAYAWGVVDTIVSSVVGQGIRTQSLLETQDGEDVELINEIRDKTWSDWAKVCELTGQLCWSEVQAICQREMAEAGEILVHMVTVPLVHNGIRRPVPLALELIEADRLATDRDTYQYSRSEGQRVVRGVELDEYGKPCAYWIYPSHPLDYHSFRREPVRIPAENILHLFRRDRVGQTRGVTWFAPAVSWMRDLGIYLDNEMQAGAVASCATAMIKTETPLPSLIGPNDGDATDTNGNQYSYLEPGAVFYLRPGESVETVNPARPNSNAEPWIALMLRGIAVGTGLSYEIVARDFSQTNYSSNRASQLEDRRRFRCWQSYLINHLCSPVWQKFNQAAALIGKVGFPTMHQLSEDFDRYAPCEFMPPTWEWVDPGTEQSSSQAAIAAYQATYADELGAKGLNWRHVFYQRAKENALLAKLGLSAINWNPNQPQQAQGEQPAQAETTQPSGELAAVSTLQFKRNRKAIESVLAELAEGKITEAKARVFLGSVGMAQESIDALIADSMDGSGKLESVEATNGDN